MNDTLKVLESRRSCRNFTSGKMVSEEDIQAIIEAGTYAPSGMGRQSSIIIAVTNKELRDQLSAENAKIMGADTDPHPLKYVMDHAIEDGKIQPLIIVLPTYNNTSEEDSGDYRQISQ